MRKLRFIRFRLPSPTATRRGPAVWSVTAVAVTALLAIATFAYVHRDRRSVGGTGPMLVAVQRGTVSVSAAAAGTVQATNTRGLSFTISGTVTKIAVEAGDTVTEGQELARLDDTDAQNAVSSAQSSVTNAENTLSDAEETASATASTSNAGCQVPAAYRAATSPSPSPTAPSSPSSSLPGSSQAPSRVPTTAAGTTPGTAPNGNGGTCAGSPDDTGSRAGNGTDSLFSAQQSLNNAKLRLAQAEADLAGTVITAPIDGRVLTVDGAVGTTASPGSTAFITLGAASDTQVEAQFSETDVATLEIGQPTEITLGSRAETFTGKVSQISPSGASSGQLVRYTVMIAFDEVPADLLYAQSANVVVTTGSATDSLYVPSSAVTPQSASKGMVTVRTNGRDEQRTVQIGLSGDQYTEIKSGLSEGDQVVVSSGG